MLLGTLMPTITGFLTESLTLHLQYMLQSFKQTTLDIKDNTMIIKMIFKFDAVARIVLSR
jgi:hypothetical protein